MGFAEHFGQYVGFQNFFPLLLCSVKIDQNIFFPETCFAYTILGLFKVGAMGAIAPVGFSERPDCILQFS